MGDWNIERHVIRDSGWPRTVKAEMRICSDGWDTCFSENGAREASTDALEGNHLHGRSRERFSMITSL